MNGYRYWGHNGGGPGIQADFLHIPELGYTVIVLSNYGDAAMPVSAKLRDLLTSKQSVELQELHPAATEF